MWSINEIKQRGKNAFKANYWPSVLVAFILGLFATGSTGTVARSGSSAVQDSGEAQSLSDAVSSLTPSELAAVLAIVGGTLFLVGVVSIILRIFLYNPLTVGCYRFFRKNAETAGAPLGTITEGFSEYGRVFLTLFLRDLFLSLWTCLFVIPGLIKGYSYRLVPYIIKDNPELSATEVITRSREMMNGNKWRAFLFDLSFLGWELLSLITCGIVGLFRTDPYKKNSDAALYLELKQN
ncbi:MAG: DUF975 family protein [Lachnospiraceae bacterium]|nr:DUF975 family protein [Lachnospiraceae bacterium]